MKTPKERILKKVQLLLISLRDKHPKQLEEASRQTAVRTLNLCLSEAMTAAPEVDESSWPKPFLEEEAKAGGPQLLGTKDQVATKARALLKLLSDANLAEKSATAAAAPAATAPVPQS